MRNLQMQAGQVNGRVNQETIKKRRLENMRNIKVFGGLASLVVMLGAIAFLAYGQFFIACGTAATCLGTNMSDFITVTANTAQTVLAYGGNDIINEDDDAANTIYAGSGNDMVYIAAANAAVAANQTVFGEAGNDFINASATGSTNTLDGGRGNDTIYGGTAADTIYDGPGRDSIRDFGGGSTIWLAGDNEPDLIIGGGGSDTINLVANSGRDEIYCGTGTDTVNLNGNTKAFQRVLTLVVNLRRVALGLVPNNTDCETINP